MTAKHYSILYKKFITQKLVIEKVNYPSNVIANFCTARQNESNSKVIIIL